MSVHTCDNLQVSSQTSSVSSCDDYIIVLPDCFDTSRPLGESMYSSAMSQPDDTVAAMETSADLEVQQEDQGDSEPGGVQQTEEVAAEDSSVNTQLPPAPPIHSSVNQMLCASQTLDAVTLTPEVVPPPVMPEPLLPPPTLYSPRLDKDCYCTYIFQMFDCTYIRYKYVFVQLYIVLFYI